MEDSISRAVAALWADSESSPPPSHILATDARFVLLHLLAQPRFGVFEFLFSLENRSISIDADATESEGSAEAETRTQQSHFPPLLSSPEDQDYNNSMTPIQDSIKYTVGHTTSSFLTPSKYFTPPPPCKIRSLAPATDGEIDGEAQVQPCPDSCWAKSGGHPSAHLSRCPPLPHQQKQALKNKGSFPTTSRRMLWVQLLREWLEEQSQSITPLWETAQTPQPQKKIHSLQAQSNTKQPQASSSYWKFPGLVTLTGLRDAAAPQKNHAQLFTHMSYSSLKSSRGKPRSLLNTKLSTSPKCKTPEKSMQAQGWPCHLSEIIPEGNRSLIGKGEQDITPEPPRIPSSPWTRSSSRVRFQYMPRKYISLQTLPS